MLWRIMPSGIAARTLLTVVWAVALTQAVSTAFYLADHAQRAQQRSIALTAERIATLVPLVDAVPASERPKVLQASNLRLLSVEWPVERPAARDGGGSFEELRKAIGEQLHDARREVVIFSVPAGGSPPGEALGVSLPLSDGSWIRFTEQDFPHAFELGHFIARMSLVSACVVLLSFWAVRQQVGPLARFAKAAERFGVDVDAPPLTEKGPREVRVATQAFNRMQQRLRRFIEDRTLMLAAISHDLRTPLTRLRLRAEFVDDADLHRKMLADLDEMETMISGTLAFARDDARAEKRVKVDLADLLQSLKDDGVDCGNDVRYEGPAHRTIECRPVALRRALVNLIDNAVKYAGAARLHLLEQPKHAIIQIDDDGPGIPADQVDRVFLPFYRIERSRSRDTGGSGLGLSVARGIARAHGGDITLENRPQGGLRVTMTLPV